MPRRRRSRAAAIEEDSERGLALRIFLHSPKDVIAGALAVLAVCAIIVNALFMQAGRHPAPMFGTVVMLPQVASAPAGTLPRPRPVEADVPLPEPRPAESRSAESKSAEPKAADQKAADPLANLVKTTSSVQPATANIPRPPLTVPISTRADGVTANSAHRVAAVQRALTEYGYGQLKPTGVIGPDTQTAIQRFERARRLPVTGQLSDRLVRELASTIGHPVE
jgi:hypothetical protein